MDIKWGETQNLLSVIFGLNIAFTAFKDLRAPHISDFQRRVSELRDRIRDVFSPVSGLVAPYSTTAVIAESLYRDVTRYLSSADRPSHDFWLGIFSMVVALATTILLIVSTVFFKEDISVWFFWTILGIGFAPPLLHIVHNYLILWHLNRRFRKELDSVHSSFRGAGGPLSAFFVSYSRSTCRGC